MSDLRGTTLEQWLETCTQKYDKNTEVWLKFFYNKDFYIIKRFGKEEIFNKQLKGTVSHTFYDSVNGKNIINVFIDIEDKNQKEL